MRLTFLGTGSSLGVPQLACNCHVCASLDPCDKRLRSSVLIEQNSRTILVDIGPDFRVQLLSHRISRLDAVLITHFHRDHVAGIDDLRAFLLASDKMPDLYVSQETAAELQHIYYYMFKSSVGASKSKPNLKIISNDRTFSIAGLQFQPIALQHGPISSTGFRFGNVAYLTDVGHVPASEFSKLKELDELIVTALQKAPHPSQFNLEQALALSRAIRPKHTYLTHVGHQLGRAREVAELLPPHVSLAYDGLVLEL